MEGLDRTWPTPEQYRLKEYVVSPLNANKASFRKERQQALDGDRVVTTSQHLGFTDALW